MDCDKALGRDILRDAQYSCLCGALSRKCIRRKRSAYLGLDLGTLGGLQTDLGAYPASHTHGGRTGHCVTVLEQLPLYLVQPESVT